MSDCVRTWTCPCTPRCSAPHRLPCGCHLASRHKSATLHSPHSHKHGSRGREVRLKEKKKKKQQGEFIIKKKGEVIFFLFTDIHFLLQSNERLMHLHIRSCRPQLSVPSPLGPGSVGGDLLLFCQQCSEGANTMSAGNLYSHYCMN